MTKRSKKSRKRENGEGTIWQRPNGTWVATVTIPRSGGRRLNASAKSRDMARVELDSLRERAKKMVSVHGKGAGRTVLELANLWVEGKSIDQVSKDSYVYALKHIGWLGGVPIQKVTALAIAEWSTDIRATCGSRSFEILAGVVKSSLEYAVTLGLLKASPFRISIPRTKPKEKIPFTMPEARAIIAEALKDRVGGAIILTMCGAFRGGELYGLRWGDIDWTTGEISVCRQVVQRKGGLQQKAPKTATGIRRVIVPPLAMDALRLRQKLAMEEGRASADWYVFPTRTGKPMSRSNFGRRHWKPLLERLKITPLRGMHCCRHTSLSIMLQQRVSIQEVANVAGHATPTILLENYAHLLPGTGRAAADAIQNALGCNAVATTEPAPEKEAS